MGVYPPRPPEVRRVRRAANELARACGRISMRQLAYVFADARAVSDDGLVPARAVTCSAMSGEAAEDELADVRSNSHVADQYIWNSSSTPMVKNGEPWVAPSGVSWSCWGTSCSYHTPGRLKMYLSALSRVCPSI